MGFLVPVLLFTCSHSVGGFKPQLPGVREACGARFSQPPVVLGHPTSRRAERLVALEGISRRDRLGKWARENAPLVVTALPVGLVSWYLGAVAPAPLLRRGICMSRMPVAAADKSGRYVERQGPEQTIRDYLAGSGTKQNYLVVYGPRGAGKSTTVQHCLLDRPGVVCVSVNENTEPSLARAVMNEAQSPLSPVLKALTASKVQRSNDKDLELMLKAVREQLGRQPTVVLDVARAAPEGTVDKCARFLKELTHDRTACRGILVLSSSYAVAEMTPDPARQRFAHVASFEEQQAREALGQRLRSKVPSSAVLEEIKDIVVNETMFAAELADADDVIPSCADGATGAEQLEAARAWADALKARALDDVLYVLNKGDADDIDLRGKRGFHADRLLRELLESDGPIKIARTMYLPIPKEFAQKLRVADEGRHALVLDLVAGTVAFGTPAHRRAAMSLLQNRPRPDDGFGDDVIPTV